MLVIGDACLYVWLPAAYKYMDGLLQLDVNMPK